MLKIVIYYKNQDITGFTVEGHANYAPKGEDIYCAGVSAITQTALIGLAHHLENIPEYMVESGDMKVFLDENISSADNEKAQIILTTMLAGLEFMEKSYNEFLKVEIRRC